MADYRNGLRGEGHDNEGRKAPALSVIREGRADELPVTATVRDIPLDRIVPSDFQPRRISQGALDELAQSIRERGILQPVLVRPSKDHPGRFQLIAGERRFRAAKMAELESIPALITAVGDQDSLELAIIENAQRQDLNPVEEALAYQQLHHMFGLSHSEVAEAIGKSRSAVANSIRLLALPSEVLDLLQAGTLSAGHARALLAIRHPDAEKVRGLQLRYAELAANSGLSVRALEQIVARMQSPEATAQPSASREQYARVEERVAQYLGVERVRVREDREGHKVVSLRFPSEAAWKRFLSKIREDNE